MTSLTNALWFKNLALQYVKPLRRYRERGEAYPQVLVNDLRLYLARYRHWNKEARRVAR